MGRFQEDVRCRFRDLRFGPAHYPCQRYRLFGICDHQVDSVQLALNSVESCKMFSWQSASNSYCTACELVEIECMEWLPCLQHHVIRHIDEVIDRSLPCRFESRLHPVRGRTD